MEKSTSSTPQVVSLPALNQKGLTVPIEGTSPLIVHRWSDKAKKQMLDKQMKKASIGKEAKDPQRDYEESLYYDEEGNYAFPAIAFKAAAVRAGTYVDMKMTYLRGAFHINNEWVRIQGEPRMREDMVRIGQGTADIRYRAEFPEWAAELKIDFNENAVSASELVNLFRVAGFSVGIGEWRPERDGQFGRFQVVGL